MGRPVGKKGWGPRIEGTKPVAKNHRRMLSYQRRKADKQVVTAAAVGTAGQTHRLRRLHQLSVGPFGPVRADERLRATVELTNAQVNKARQHADVESFNERGIVVLDRGRPAALLDGETLEWNK